MKDIYYLNQVWEREYFFAGSKHVAIKVVASYTEDQIITSDPRQLLEIEEAKDEFDKEEGEGKMK